MFLFGRHSPTQAETTIAVADNPASSSQQQLPASPAASTSATQGGDPWLNGFPYRKPISIAGSTSTLTQFQVNVTIINETGKMNANYTDLRFTASDGVTLLPYWCENCTRTTNATFWVKVPSIPTTGTTIYAYYGNPQANDAQNATGTFVAWDDFTSDTGQWTKVDPGSNFAIVNGRLEFTNLNQNNAEHSYVYKNIAPMGDFAMDYKWLISSYSVDVRAGVGLANSTGSMAQLAGSGTTGGIYGGGTFGNWIIYTASNNYEAALSPGSTTGSPNYVTLTRAGSTVIFNIFSDPERTSHKAGSPVTWSSAHTALYHVAYAYSDWAYTATATSATGYVDDLRIRKYSSPEPSATQGTEESLTTMAGGAQSWTWKVPTAGEYVRSGGAQDWNWKPYQQYLGRYRKPITLTGSTSALTDYQVNVTPYIYNETGLVGSWHFSESSGRTTADSSGQGNTGTLNNGANITTDGKFGNAMKFDGVDDSVRIADSNSLDLTSEITVEAWIYPTKYTVNGEIIAGKHSSASPGTGYNFFIYPSTNKISLQFGDGVAGWPYADTQSSSALGLNTWYHVAATRSGTQVKFYLNGQPDGTATVGANNIAANTRDLWIGDNVDAPGTARFNGTIDEVRIYNRALSASEIQSHYNATKARLDYADVRFTDSSNNLLPFWMESDGKFWVKVPSIPTSGTTIYAYYGNPSATDAQNGTGTFIGFGGLSSFTKGDPASQIRVDSDSIVSVLGGVAGNNAYLYKDIPDTGDFTFEFESRIDSHASCGNFPFAVGLSNSGTQYARTGSGFGVYAILVCNFYWSLTSPVDILRVG